MELERQDVEDIQILRLTEEEAADIIQAAQEAGVEVPRNIDDLTRFMIQVTRED